ncbi:hypothetical protein S7711_02712 [Stachybotrys chartarum IBT 7711]|uniref:Carrier domain-containing protein n=1 Tax=Stachybotrys chartarum (strain CBS 109288 / IBT 7711) TaxID=1280523 RepID=A0A084AZ29_STACB|nr:hypothetical protein S7711_02712 [Stachybotrys chartarum IBT 7711]KFA54362.1 hypothetical protein S40293_04308 [Stachybotrys chartarum IBT 40293]
MEAERSKQRGSDFASLDKANETVLTLAGTLSVPRNPDSWLDLGADEDLPEDAPSNTTPRDLSREVEAADSDSDPTVAPPLRRRPGTCRPHLSDSTIDLPINRLSDASSAPDDVFTSHQEREVSSEDSSMGSFEAHTPSSASTDFNVAVRDNRQAELENLLLSTSKAGNVCLVTPRNGPFQDKLVAVLTNATSSAAGNGEISLPSDSESDDEACKTQIEAFAQAVQKWESDSPRPDAWVILQCMPMDEDGSPDVRALQNWAETMGEKVERRVMGWQPREEPVDDISMPNEESKSPQHEKLPAWPEYLPTLWNEDEVAAAAARSTLAEHKETELYALSAMQQLYFRTSVSPKSDPRAVADPGIRFTQSMLLHIRGGAALPDIEAAVEALSARHSMLRARFPLTPDGWAQVIAPHGRSSYRFGHSSVESEIEILAIMEQAQASINVTTGPLFSVDHIRTGDGRQLLHLVAHHLVVDLPSWHIIVHDLDGLLSRGHLLSTTALPFPHWIDYQNNEAKTPLAKLPFDITPTNLAYWKLDRGFSNTYADTESLRFVLSPETTHLIQTCTANSLRADAADMMLAALLYSFCLTFPDRDAPTVWKQELGRESASQDFSIKDTVGWFTSLCPVTVSAGTETGFVQVLKMVKDTRRSIPRSGSTFFAAEFSSSNTPQTKIPVEITFNCVDNLQRIHRKGGVLEPVPAPGHDASGLMSDVGLRVGRIALFEVSVVIEDGAGTRVEALFNKHSQHHDRITTWIRKFEKATLEGIDKLRAMEPELTLADTPLLKTSYRGMAQLSDSRLSALGLDSVVDIETIYPVSPAQQEILIAQAQDLDCFHVHSIYELGIAREGYPVDQARLCSAWEKLVATHPALRSVFIDSVSDDGLFDQVILKKISPDMLFLDSDRPEETLASLPSMRPAASHPRHRLSVCTTKHKTFIRVDASQAICDASSIHNLVLQLRQVYSGTPLAVDETLLLGHRERISTLDRSSGLDDWRRELADAKPCMFPPLTLHPQEMLQSRSFQLEITRDQLDSHCRGRQVDPSIVIRLAWALVLRSFVGTKRVTFGYLLSGRDEELSPAIHSAIGSFATLLPCYVDLGPDPTLGDCLKNLVTFDTKARQRQFLTVMEIQHAMHMKGDNLFNTCLSFLDQATIDDEGPSFGFDPKLITSARTSEFNLSLTVTSTRKQLHVNVGFRHLSATQAHNAINTFEQALRAILNATDRQPVSSLDLFTGRDYAQLVVSDLESTMKGDKVSACLHRQILQHAPLRPDAPAVCAWDGNLSYQQLEVFVARLATYLVNVGVRPGVPIPIMLEKNRWLPVVMLAVLEAGGCFICLDHHDKTLAETTIRYLNPPIVIASEITSWKGVSPVVINLSLLSDIFFAALPPQTTVLAVDATPDHAACVFFTPSKTNPATAKSIFFTHTSLCSAFAAQGRALRITENSRVFQLSPLSGDIALVEILCTLLHGGCVCIPKENEKIPDIGKSMARMRITWSYMTTVLARRIDPTAVPSLRTLCFRTRSLDRDTYGPWLNNREVLLAYGAPDVCPLGIAFAEVSSSTSTISNLIPPPLLGRFWILNPDDPKKLMPIGAMGELGIDSPELTPQRYIPGRLAKAPSSGQEAAKLKGRYLKTGHRVRYLDSGNIQFISSMRDEIVIGGTPVFVTDVEQCIRRCLGPKIDVAVDMVTTSDNIQVLVAFLELGSEFKGPSAFEEMSTEMKEKTFLLKKQVEASMANIQEHLKRVPMHHIPSAFVPLKHFPISSTLKVNKRKIQRSLAAMSYEQLMGISTVSNPAEVLRAKKPLPLTQGEDVMRRIWAAVLDKAPIDIRGCDSFLSLGGDRYLAAKMVVACRQAGFNVALSNVLRGLTLTEVCQAVAASDKSFNNAQGPSDGKNLLASAAGFDERFIKDVICPQLQVHWHDVIDVTVASAYQIRNLELGLYESRGDINCLVLRFNGPIRHQRLEAACEALTRQHPILRTAFAVHERRVYQILLKSFKAPFQRVACAAARLERLSEEAIKQDQEQHSRLGDPATRFIFLDAIKQGVLVIRVSFAQVDEASVSLLVQDLIALYDDASPVPKATFYDYMRASQAANCKDGMDFWKEQLAGAKMTQVVSHSKPYGPVAKVKTVAESVKVDPVLGITFDTVLKAAWANVLATLSGSSDVLFGERIYAYNIELPNHVDVTSLIGPLTNIIPVRVGFPAEHSTPLALMRFLQNQRGVCRPYESAGFPEIVQNCSEWSYWTRFSTVVHHRSQAPMDGTTTLNMGNTTFTYKLMPPPARDCPDLYVCSTLDGPGKVDIEITYPEGRVSTKFATNAMTLLVSAIGMMTGAETQAEPLLPSAGELERIEPDIPLPKQDAPDDDKIPLTHLLSSEQRVAIHSIVNNAWTEILNPTALGVPKAQREHANFYDLWGSLLTASFFADYFNKELPKLKFPGVDKIHVSAEDIMEHPNITAQVNLLALKMRDCGAITLPARRKSSTFSTSSGIWAPAPLTWKRSLRKLRPQESRSSMRDLGSKAGDWMRHKVNGGAGVGSREGASTPTMQDPILELGEEHEDAPPRSASGQSAHGKIRFHTPPVELGPSSHHQANLDGVSPLSPWTPFSATDDKKALLPAAAGDAPVVVLPPKPDPPFI